MEETEQDKSEQPSHYKLSRARRKGQVARGMDLGFVTGLAAFTAYFWMMGPTFGSQIGRAARGALVAGPQVLESRNAILAVTGSVLSVAIKPVAFLAGVVFLVVLAFEIVQTGFVFSTEPLKLDFNRLNPAQGLKRLFTVRLLIETAKNILKLVVYTTLAFLIIRQTLKVNVASITTARSLAEAMSHSALRMLAIFVVAAVVFAVIDQLIVRREFMKKMRMSRRELKREVRDREGEPRLKQKRKQLHAEFVKRANSMRNVRGADVLITNPTHYAVALKYDPRTMYAPTIVSQGAHQFAQRLKQLAFVYGVTVVQDPPLARALYRCALDQQIPDTHYRRVADIYLKMREERDNRASVSHA